MIYFIQMGHSGPIKIGFTAESDAIRRLAELQTACPWRLRLLGTTGGEPEDENRMHRTFRHLRTQGEWFLPGRDLLEFIAPHTDLTPSEIDDCLPVHDLLNSLPAPLYQVALEIAGDTKVTVADVLIEAIRDGLKTIRPRWEALKREREPKDHPTQPPASSYFEDQIEYFMRLAPVPVERSLPLQN